MRPVSGGRLEIARKKFGTWWFEAKLGGMRISLHVESGAMWNRQNERIKNPHWFAKAVKKIQERNLGIEWLDCEGLYHAHEYGKGTLVILDAIVQGLTIEERGTLYFDSVEIVPFTKDIPKDEVFRTERYRWEDRDTVWQELKKVGAPLFEGIVAKQGGSKYACQRVSATRESPFWSKHRFDM